MADALLAHIKKNSGQRGEQIAAALGTDTTSMRPAMHMLIAEKKVKTRGERRPSQGPEKRGDQQRQCSQ